MRLVRPLVFFAFLSAFTSTSLSQQVSAPPVGVNFLLWDTNSPTPTTGGVNLSVKAIPTTGYTCTEVRFVVVDSKTLKELDEFVVPNPPNQTVSKAFTGYANNLAIQVYAYATFSNGTVIDPKAIQATATTK